MRLLSRWGIVPRAWAARHGGEWVVRLRLGGLWYVLDADEAAELARQLGAAVEDAKVGRYANQRLGADQQVDCGFADSFADSEDLNGR